MFLGVGKECGAVHQSGDRIVIWDRWCLVRDGPWLRFSMIRRQMTSLMQSRRLGALDEGRSVTLGVFVQCGFIGKLPSHHGEYAVAI
jgi:hypothetical protein